MDLAVVMICFGDRSWNEALDVVSAHGIHHVEPCSGGFFPKVHYEPQHLLTDAGERQAFERSLRERDLQISCLSVCGNPLHPNRERAREADEDFVATCRLAGELGVERIGVLSGCPAGAADDETVNWITPVLSDDPYPDALQALEWQWNEKAIPYWSKAAEVAKSCGVRLCMEPIAGNLVYDPASFERLRGAVGPTIGALFDPSHFFWMGFDIDGLVARFGDAIYYAHAKDVRIDPAAVGRDGLVPPVGYDQWDARPWMPRAPGIGHPPDFWARYFTSLRGAGYDGPVAIEIEEPLLTVDDAISLSVAILSPLMPSGPPPSGNWFDVYAPS